MNYNYYFDDSLSLHNVTCTHKQYSRRRKIMQDSLDTESGHKIAKNYPYNMQVYSTILIKSKQSKGNKKNASARHKFHFMQSICNDCVDCCPSVACIQLKEWTGQL